MNNIAICFGNTIIYWNSLIIALGALGCFALTMAVYRARGGRVTEMWVMFPIACVLSVLLARIIHWYCHTELYSSLGAALTDFTSGDYCLTGVLIGVIIAVLFVRVVRLAPSAAVMFDSLAPGAALLVAIIRLSALFSASCRSKITVTNPSLQHLPLASAVSLGGVTEYRFATFFAEFIIFLVVFVLILAVMAKHSRSAMKNDYSDDGHIGLMFLVFFSAVELIMDSTRYDSSFLRSNGFVSLVQIVSAVSILAILVFYSIRSVKCNRLRIWHFLLWVLYLATVGGVGATEYLVQRHGNWFLPCYGGMAVCCIVMAVIVFTMYRSTTEEKY